MNALKSVFNFLGRFLTSTRIVVTNLITFIFLALVFIGLISVFIPNDRSIDKEGKVVILNPEGVLVDQEVQYSDFQFSFGQVEQIQTRDLIKLIQSISKDEDIPAVLLDFSGLSYELLMSSLQAPYKLFGASLEPLWNQNHPKIRLGLDRCMQLV